MIKWLQLITRVSKRVAGNTRGIKLKMKIFFLGNRRHQDIKGWDHWYNVEGCQGTNKYMEDILGTKVENVLYFIWNFKLEVLGKHGRKDVGGGWKDSQKIFLKQSKVPKWTSWML